MYSRLLKPPRNKSFFLFGPRGTGKTTWVKSTFPKAIYLDLLEAEIFNDLLANPQRLENYLPKKTTDFVIIDEIQRIPQLLNEVHRLIEKLHLKFILTGSSARKLRERGQNLLAGRALTYFMYPLTAIELNADFNLNLSLNFGLLPSVYQEKEPKKYLESYVKTYLEEEIFQEGLTRNLSAFARFLETASFSQGSVLNTSEIAREAAVERKVVENYFSILEDLLIGYRLPVFNKKAKRRLIVHPKFYFFDTGMYRIVRPMGPLDSPEMVEGISVESLFFQNLLAVNDNLNLGYKLYYYRTATGIEVDFIAYGERGIRAFEIKRTDKVSSKTTRGLKHFLKEYPQTKGFFLYGGKRKMRHGDIEIIPFEDALKNLPDLLL
ncbi:ATPase [Candidatus Shapirobacteria bacterium CG03_land_8_20_14_0_80_40_19]|uniref:ATPase n=4 Tax=Candidatus Shapironibacteriota TaxID=1752721 RepID=A0A2M7BBA3_9BACT|nr:MAG: ATPase [Candidatus Shapirobacteria bacterium CG11_big_fil_rev_8_21_14_0_20_40_12]PIV00386.1 MAG: ATPase [Candidatus Shapirobacteria bacterium CG03_land_8_20_14_0_80_40_19]PJC28559.1 MAG: ATPase [Candidatus Shapirobacteria bacterium CG_4_9_14_0_2_um_filter_40_11]PJC76733.1 MAG: ATPase [Candidatus Shapirobacteria bacterium CG_4_8_14_3_um_filter_39_11]